MVTSIMMPRSAPGWARLSAADGCGDYGKNVHCQFKKWKKLPLKYFDELTHDPQIHGQGCKFDVLRFGRIGSFLGG
nr:hypothetical protein [uncultured Celeribacter sp.]